MQILIVAATPFEIEPLKGWLKQHFTSLDDHIFSAGDIQIELLITGIGLTATAYALGKKLAERPPELVINAGVCGALDRKLAIGEVVLVVEESFSDLGAEGADGTFLDLFDLNLANTDLFPFQHGKLIMPGGPEANFLPRAAGISVNKTHGSEQEIERLIEKYPDAQVESMEGAAVFWACLHAGAPFMEIRSVSNFVEARNRENWNIPQAIESLNTVMMNVIQSL